MKYKSFEIERQNREENVYILKIAANKIYVDIWWYIERIKKNIRKEQKSQKYLCSENFSERNRKIRGAICISFKFCRHDGKWEVEGRSEFVGIFHASINVWNGTTYLGATYKVLLVSSATGSPPFLLPLLPAPIPTFGKFRKLACGSDVRTSTNVRWITLVTSF